MRTLWVMAIAGLMLPALAGAEVSVMPCMARDDVAGWRIDVRMGWQGTDAVVQADMQQAGFEPPERLALAVERGPNWRTGTLRVEFEVPPMMLVPADHEVLVAVDRDRVLSAALPADAAARQSSLPSGPVYWELTDSAELGRLIAAAQDVKRLTVSLFRKSEGFQIVDRADFDGRHFWAAYQRMKALEQQVMTDRQAGTCRLP